MPASFHEHDVKSGLKDKRKLSAFLDKLVRQYRKGKGKVSLTYIFCADDYLLAMNKQFLDHDTYTDIITFDLTGEGEALAGEIYISTDRISENALKFGVTYNDELHRVIFHGALHLCGFKDKSAADKKKMRDMEDKCLAEYFN
ncbi:MAG: rRNA maturation RNase YbeY [Chitinophagaceae bacterium]|nr:rRNA maturation RNase YbeY [Chitinophagaceae bacterium]